MPTIPLQFPSVLNTREFEAFLKAWYPKSKRKDVDLVIFDLKRVVHCDIFELSLIAIWIQELANKKKKIELISPRNRDILDTLVSYNFYTLLEKNKIWNDPNPPRLSVQYLARIPYFPLKFYSEKDFIDLMGYINIESNFSETFSDSLECKVIDKAYLRNIVIKELSENIYKHADGKLACFIMSNYQSFDKTPSGREKWSNKLQRDNPFESGFFRRLEGEEFITCVFADKGPGIYKKLKESFARIKPDELSKCNVLLYAFEKNSTSRSNEERLGEINKFLAQYENYFSDSLPILPPPTGLFILLNIVKEFHGFLYLRSGSSIISFDFYKQGTEPIVKRSDKLTGFKNLVQFGGTQIKIHFPVNLPSSYRQGKAFIIPETNRKVSYVYRRISDFYEIGANELSAKGIGNLFTLIEDHQVKEKRSLSGLIIDLEEQFKTTTKELYFIVAKLMYSQTKNYTHVLINIKPKTISSIKKIFRDIDRRSFRPIVFFDTHFQRDILGLDSKGANIFEGLFSKTAFNSEDDLAFIKENDHLFLSDGRSISFKHRRISIFVTARKSLQNKLNTIILDKQNKIYNAGVKVLLPSGIYCEGYFEIANLLRNNNYFSMIRQWVAYLLFEFKPNNIISLGKHCKKIIDYIYNDYASEDISISAKHFNIEKPLELRFPHVNSISNQISKKDRTLVITDVIGTTISLARFLQHFSHVDNFEVYTIVNATQGNRMGIPMTNKEIPISQIAKRSLRFYNDRPADWKDDVLLNVDSESHVLIRKKVSIKEPLWAKYRKTNFLEHTVFQDSKYLIGHFTHDVTHIIFLFDIPQIIKHHGDEIASIISSHLEENSLLENKKSTIVYFSDKEPIHKISYWIARKHLLEIDVIDNSDILNMDELKGNEFLSRTIIAIDDAFDSGENILKLIDFCYRKQAKEIIIYVIIKRGSDYSFRRIDSIKYYDTMKVTFNYIAQIEVPTYKSESCPICNQINELNDIARKTLVSKHLESIHNSIQRRIDLIQENQVEIIEDGYNSKSVEKDKTISKELKFRVELQNSIHSSKSRSFIYRVVQDYYNKPSDFLLMIKLLGRERIYCLLDFKNESESYKHDFVNKLDIAIRHFINKSNSLRPSDYDYLLYAVHNFFGSLFLEKLYSLMNKAVKDENRFNILIKHLFISDEANKHPERVKAVFSQFLNKEGIERNIYVAINYLRNFWGDLATPLKYSTLKIYRKLKTNNHETIKSIDRAKSSLRDLPLNINLSIQEISNLNTSLTEFTRLLSSLIDFEFKDSSIIKNSEILINKTKSLQNDLIKHLNLFKKNVYDNPEGAISTIDTLRSVIYDRSDFSLESIIDLCESNVLQLLHKTFEIDTILEKQKIGIDIVAPKSIAPICFGDSHGLMPIFHNIIENKRNATDVSKILTEISIDSELENVNIHLYDDGTLPRHIKIGEGLELCRNRTEHYFGNYDLKPLNNTNKQFNDGYRTVAIVTLKYLKT